MQLPHIGIDGLLICLRPAFSAFNPRISYLLFNSLRISTKFGGPPLQCIQQKKRIFQQTQPKGRDVGDTKEWARPNQSIMVDKLYHRLNRQISKIDFLRVYETVGELVRQHGEAPNRRLFLALILANTNAENGSITEVLRLLREMADNGIEPDSTIFHAVLKVDVETLGLNVETHCPS